MAVKKNNMSKMDLISALAVNDKDEARGMYDAEEEHASYDASSNSLKDLKHYSKQEFAEALTYFEKFAPGNPEMNRMAYTAIMVCMERGWS